MFNYVFKFISSSMKLGHMEIHACQIGPADTTPLPWDRLNRPASGQREQFEAGSLSATFLHSLLGVISASTLSHLDPWLWCYWLPSEVDVDVGQPGLSSSFIAELLVANTGVYGEVWHWVLGGGGCWPPLP